MNSTFKISALAVLVSVGLTACSGYKDKSPAQSTPTVINKQDNIKKPTQPEKKAEQTKPATPTTKVEQPKSEAKPEVKPETKAEQPTPIPDAVSNKPGSTDLVAINPQQTKPEVKSEQKITQKGKSVTTDELPTVHFKNGKGVTTDELPEGKPEQSKPNYENVVTIGGKINVIDESEVDKLDWRYYGPKSGSFWINTSEMSNGNQLGIFEGEVDTWDYMMVNQPYSNYGILAKDGFWSSEWLGISGGAHTGFEPHSTFKESYIIGKINNGVKEINPELHGSATYQGPVIRVHARDYSLSKDGSVTLNANFAKTLDKSSIKGEIDSLSVGKITFEQTDLTQTQPGLESVMSTHEIIQQDGKKIQDGLGFHGKAVLGDSTGVYAGSFHGPKLDDVKGSVSFGSGKYNAVFGGTKQPK